MTIGGVEAVGRTSSVSQVYYNLRRSMSNNLSPIRGINFPYQNRPTNSLENTSPYTWQIGSFYSIFNFLINNQGVNKGSEVNLKNETYITHRLPRGNENHLPSPSSLGEDGCGSEVFSSQIKKECNLCQGRRYVCSNGETSDGISTIITGRESRLRVQHHESQHLHQARINAGKEGRVVVSQYIHLQYSICSECGETYVSSGKAVTHTLSKLEFQAFIQQVQSPTYQSSGLPNDQKPEGKGINIDFYG